MLISKIFDSFFEYKCFNEKNGAILCVTQIRNYNTQCCAWVCTCIHISKNIEVSHKCLDAKKVSACMIDDTIFFFYRFSAQQQHLLITTIRSWNKKEFHTRKYEYIIKYQWNNDYTKKSGKKQKKALHKYWWDGFLLHKKEQVDVWHCDDGA